MISDFLKLNELLSSNKVKFYNNRFIDTAKNYSFYHISNTISLPDFEKKKIDQSIRDSQLIVITQNQNLNQGTQGKYLIIGFEQSIIFLNQSSISFLYNILQENSSLPVCFLADTTDIITQKIKNPIIENDQIFKEEILNMERNFHLVKGEKSIKYIWSFILPCISAYLIKKSYFKQNSNRIEKFSIESMNKKSIEILNGDEYVELRNVGNGSSFYSILIYHIKRGELFIIKKPSVNDDFTKLNQREEMNYMKLNHPLLPKFYGKVKQSNYIVIEFINGQTLNAIDSNFLTNENIITIIFELMLILKYFHDNKLIYRDLKPTNIMIDENKTVVLIDFDRLVNIDHINYIQTFDWGSNYHAPELCETGQFTYESDIYSLGKVMKYLIDKTGKNNDLNEICNLCINENPKERPSISVVIDMFLSIHPLSTNFENYLEKNDIFNQLKFLFDEKCVTKDIKKSLYYQVLLGKTNYHNVHYILGAFYSSNHYASFDINKSIYYYSLASNYNSEASYKLGQIYFVGKYVTRDINKAMDYYSLASDQNNPKAQFSLGTIYFEGKYTKRNIDKAIHYYTLASKQNHVNAQHNLGSIYLEEKYLNKDIQKAIYYLSLAANNNHSEAQFQLGLIYHLNKYGQKDTKKAIHYFSLASYQNHSKAQLYLGAIYLDKEHDEFDIDKAIYFTSLSANQNNAKAQCNLGYIYSNNEYLRYDINKAIYYYKLAANQNLSMAQEKLGDIFYDNKYGNFDINSAIHYYTLAANQNCEDAQFNLACIYFEEKYIKRDIDKSIKYLSLAAEQGHVDAQFDLGIFFYEGKYIKPDINKSIHYFSLASNQDHEIAEYILGIIYLRNIKNIEKSIHYFSLSAKHKFCEAQFYLGKIYHDGIFVVRDIDRAIYYYSLAADQNHVGALLDLGFIYHEGKYVKRDIIKAIKYYSLASNLNSSKAQNDLGVIYNREKKDIQKAIYYYTQSSNQGNICAHINLGLLYFEGIDVARDINKSIYYLSLAANKNNSFAQYQIGMIFYIGKYCIPEIQKGIYYLKKASENGYKESYFAYGFILHEGKNVKKNIKEAIHLYKEASSFNNQYAKNNLAMIYKNGDGVEQNIDFAIEYLNEGIRLKNDILSMYNLANIYLYIRQNIDKSIELLYKIDDKFEDSLILLSLALIKKFGSDYESIINEILKHSEEISDFSKNTVCRIIIDWNLFLKSNFETLYNFYRNKDFIYNIELDAIPIVDDQEMKSNIINISKNITSDFYEGFGYDLLSNLGIDTGKQ